MLLGGMKTACRQDPRGPELLGLECENGPATKRGLYVWNGFMVYVTCHHKAKRSTNREFVVVRFMSVRLGHVMYKNLVYIRRFLEMLELEQESGTGSAVQSRLLFRCGHAPNKPLDTSRLTAILRKATAEVWGQSVNSRLYRQLVIGITEKRCMSLSINMTTEDLRLT